MVKLVQTVNIDLLLDRIEELQQAPNAPNLYWALTMLPDPLIILRPVVDWERQMLLSATPELKDPDRTRSPDEWHQIATRLTEAMNQIGSSPNARLVLMPMETSGLVGTIAGIPELAKSSTRQPD